MKNIILIVLAIVLSGLIAFIGVYAPEQSTAARIVEGATLMGLHLFIMNRVRAALNPVKIGYYIPKKEGGDV